MNLLEKYHPAQLSEIVGNDRSRVVLAGFCLAPYPAAWLLEGPSGIGKTTAATIVAKALANPANILTVGGWDCPPDLIRGIEENWRVYPWDMPDGSPGWHVLLIDEVDQCSPQTKKALLTFLDWLAKGRRGRGIVLLTSNRTIDFEDRLWSRLQVLHWTYDGLEETGAAYLLDLAEREEIPLTPEQAAEIMRDAGGNMRTAINELQNRAGVILGELALA